MTIKECPYEFGEEILVWDDDEGGEACKTKFCGFNSNGKLVGECDSGGFTYWDNHAPMREKSTPKKIESVMDLPAVCHVRTAISSVHLITHRSGTQLIETSSYWITLDKLQIDKYQWSSDLKTWYDF